MSLSVLTLLKLAFSSVRLEEISMQATNLPIIETEVLGPNSKKPLSLQTILADASYLKSFLIFSVVLNVLLICGVVSLLSQRGSGTPVITLPSPTQTPTPSPIVTTDPQAERTELEKCFLDCEPREFVMKLREQLQKVTNFKAVGDYTNLQNSNCYGYYTEATAPDKTFTSYFFAQACKEDATYAPKQTEFRIGSRAYLLNNSNGWDQSTITASAQSELIDIADLVINQQDITSAFEQRGSEQVRVLTTESEKVNDFNQLVKTTVQIKVSENYQILYFRNFEERAFNINSRFWDYNVPNLIEPPAE